jgi:hypothetical protein
MPALTTKNILKVFFVTIGILYSIFLRYSIVEADRHNILLNMEELTKSQKRMQAIKKTREFNKKNYPNVQYISSSQALAFFNLGKIILIDVNTRNYFLKEKHIINAINIPIDKMSHVRINLPKKQLIGVYCQ